MSKSESTSRLSTNHQDLITSCVSTLEEFLGSKKSRYNKSEDKLLVDLGREVGEHLVIEGCHDESAIVAATLGDLPYTVKARREVIEPRYGKLAGNAWHELSTVRAHSHLEDCVKPCDCSGSGRCKHTHKKKTPRNQ